MKQYKLNEADREHVYKLLKRQLRKAVCWQDSPVLEYLLYCREQVRFCIFAREEEQNIAKTFIKEKKNK